jgi:hypothetical protein
MKNKIIIGLPCSPSFLSIPTQIIQATSFLVSYGGGIGGANKTYYATDCYAEQPINGFYQLTLIDGSKVSINPRFVVETQKVNLIKITTDTTPHSNYYSIICKQSISIEWFKLEDDEEFEWKAEYKTRDEKRLVFKKTYLEN